MIVFPRSDGQPAAASAAYFVSRRASASRVSEAAIAGARQQNNEHLIPVLPAELLGIRRPRSGHLSLTFPGLQPEAFKCRPKRGKTRCESGASIDLGNSSPGVKDSRQIGGVCCPQPCGGRWTLSSTDASTVSLDGEEIQGSQTGADRKRLERRPAEGISRGMGPSESRGPDRGCGQGQRHSPGRNAG